MKRNDRWGKAMMFVAGANAAFAMTHLRAAPEGWVDPSKALLGLLISAALIAFYAPAPGGEGEPPRPTDHGGEG